MMAQESRPFKESDFIIELQRNDFANDYQLAKEIKEHISYGRSVVIRRYPGEHVPLTSTNVSQVLGLSPKRKVIAHGKF